MHSLCLLQIRTVEMWKSEALEDELCAFSHCSGFYLLQPEVASVQFDISKVFQANKVGIWLRAYLGVAPFSKGFLFRVWRFLLGNLGFRDPQPFGLLHLTLCTLNIPSIMIDIDIEYLITVTSSRTANSLEVNFDQPSSKVHKYTSIPAGRSLSI